MQQQKQRRQRRRTRRQPRRVAARSDGSRGTLRPAADANWRSEMACAFSGPGSYALLFLLRLFITEA